MIKLIAGLMLSYCIGSIPTGYLFGNMRKGIDLRKHGSGNMGATNAFRVLGKTIGTTVLILDILKGTLAVLLMKYFFYDPNLPVSESLVLCAFAVAVVSGHNWTIFLKFKGGKGIATTLGALIAFSILIDRFVWVVLSVVALWLIIFITTGFVSLASVLCSITLPLLAIFFRSPIEILIFCIILAAFSLSKHKANISRLLHKKESRFNTRQLFKTFSKKTLSK
jgi:glycerol-3-phosphate acyltransferase PlsY